jgi:hypothetical protein
MLNVQTVDPAQFKRHQHFEAIEANMSDEPKDTDATADRLEAALERIARLTAGLHARPTVDVTPRPEAELSIPQIVGQLDSLIDRLHAALDIESSTSKPEPQENSAI